MTILQIIVLTILAIIIGQLSKGRQLALLAISTFAIFWLQPNEPFLTLIFWLPVATLGITLLCWALTSTPEVRSWRQNWPTVTVLTGIVILMDLNRIFKFDQIFTSGTPVIQETLAGIIGLGALTLIILSWQKAGPFLQAAAFIGIILIFIVLKAPNLIYTVRSYLVNLRGADLTNKPTVISWLGYSYISFRLLHTIRDRQSGRLPSVTLAEFFNYVIFFPSFTAGPIDRIERFVKELRTSNPLSKTDWIDAATRLFVGLFKKFVIADLLAVISLNDVLVSQVKSTGWLWVFLYAYAFRIYFDFSGYTDVAIGMGLLMGIRLPENFKAPYLKSNLTQFWNSWHMSLTQWYRAYFFNPVTRALRSREQNLPVWCILLFTQVSTMLLIGLWHGVTTGFALWGLWHGIGLFLQNRWSEFIRTRLPNWTQTRGFQLAANVFGVLFTFNFVALGWLFFNLSSPAIAWLAMKKLFGII